MFKKLLLIFGFLCVLESTAIAATLPSLPTPMDPAIVAMPTITGTTTTTTCANLQTTLNTVATTSNSNPTLNYQITITPANTVCPGTFNLPAHNSGTGWIVITGPNGGIVPPGTRQPFSNAVSMPSIQWGSGGGLAINALNNAQRYRFVGVQIVDDPATAFTFWFVCLGSAFDLSCGGANVGYIIFDRILLQDTKAANAHGTTHAIFANAAGVGNIALIDSSCRGIGRNSSDGNPAEAQCLYIDKNAGPILVRNNFLSAAGENIMFGGGDEAHVIADIPQDITIQYNDFTLDSEFQNGNQNTYPDTKTLLEFKEGLRVLVEGNRFSNMYSVGLGYAMRMTARNSLGGSVASQNTDITIRYNLFHDNTNFQNWLGSDVAGQGASSGPTSQSKRWYIHDNLMYNMGTGCLPASSGACGEIYQNSGGDFSTTACTTAPNCGLQDVTFAHNTMITSGEADKLMAQSSTHNVNLEFKDNIVSAEFGFGTHCLDTAQSAGGVNGVSCLNAGWDATWSFHHNIMANIGGTSSQTAICDNPPGTGDCPANYPNSGGNASNQYPQPVVYGTYVKFTNPGANDYTLQAGSPAKNAASDGTDMGVNFPAYNAAQSGNALPPPPPPPFVDSLGKRLIVRVVEVLLPLFGIGWHFRRQIVAMVFMGITFVGTVGSFITLQSSQSYHKSVVITRQATIKALETFIKLTPPKL